MKWNASALVLVIATTTLCTCITSSTALARSTGSTQSERTTLFRAATWQKAEMMRVKQRLAHMKGSASPHWPHSHCAGRCHRLVTRYRQGRIWAQDAYDQWLKRNHPPLRQVSDWICLHEHEGAWNATGFYEGGLQMDRTFSHSYGEDMYVKYSGQGPYAWSIYDQITVAQRAYDSGRGYGPWPNTRIMCGI